MNSSIPKIINGLIDREGLHSNHKSDAGGDTMWGITIAVARKHGYRGNMQDMPRQTAYAIYMVDYVILPGFDKVINISDRIGEELVDTGVNMGQSLPGVWLQRILNVMNQQSQLYGDLQVDGHIGPATIGALTTFLNKRGQDGEKVILRALNSFQGVRYIEITEGRLANEDFVYGWFLNRVEIA